MQENPCIYRLFVVIYNSRKKTRIWLSVSVPKLRGDGLTEKKYAEE